MGGEDETGAVGFDLAVRYRLFSLIGDKGGRNDLRGRGEEIDAGGWDGVVSLGEGETGVSTP